MLTEYVVGVEKQARLLVVHNKTIDIIVPQLFSTSETRCIGNRCHLPKSQLPSKVSGLNKRRATELPGQSAFVRLIY